MDREEEFKEEYERFSQVISEQIKELEKLPKGKKSLSMVISIQEKLGQAVESLHRKVIALQDQTIEMEFYRLSYQVVAARGILEHEKRELEQGILYNANADFKKNITKAIDQLKGLVYEENEVIKIEKKVVTRRRFLGIMSSTAIALTLPFIAPNMCKLLKNKKKLSSSDVFGIREKRRAIAKEIIEEDKKDRKEKIQRIEKFWKLIQPILNDKRPNRGLKGDEKISLFIYDLKNDKEFFTLDANESVLAGSMIEPFIATIYFYLLENQTIPKYTFWDKRHMKLMLRKSNKRATRKLIERVGGVVEINLNLQRNPEFEDITKTEIKKIITPKGVKYEKRTCAKDCSAFLEALNHRTIPGHKEILKHMQHSRTNFLIRHIPGNVSCWNKTGASNKYLGDMGIIETGNQKYAFVGIINRDKKWIKWSTYTTFTRRGARLLRDISSVVAQELKNQ